MAYFLKKIMMSVGVAISGDRLFYARISNKLSFTCFGRLKASAQGPLNQHENGLGRYAVMMP